ncbi:MAG: aldolase/citrate lyase family protein [Pseudomonadota bacterium]
MTFGDLRRRLEAGEVMPLGWVSSPEPINGVVLAKAGFEVVCADMQHAPIGSETMAEICSSVIAAGAAAIVRPPLFNAGAIGSALDAGAEAVIAPMINTAEDAEWFVKWSKFPPVGERSWGPAGVVRNHGLTLPDYLEIGNRSVSSIAMIETREAMGNMTAILGNPHIDGIFVGPNDLCVSLTGGEAVDPGTQIAMDAATEIAKAVRDAGKFAGIFAVREELALAYKEMGYQLIVPGNDIMLLDRGAKAALSSLKGG